MELKDEFHDQSEKAHKMSTFQQNNLTKPKLSTLTRKLTGFLSTDLTDQDSDALSKKRTRLVSKRGRVNVVAVNVEHRNLRFFADCFTTLIDCKWYWIGLVFSACFLTSWLVFGSLWWLIVWLRTRHNPSMICVENVNSWTSAFLFSIETQTTIGYGGRQITANCPEGILCLVIQSITGLTISASLMGLIFAKVSRPRPRAQTIVFSSNAVISTKNGARNLSFRVGDVRKSQLLEVTLKLHCFRFGLNRNNEKILLEQIELPLFFTATSEPDYEVRPFFLTPLTVSHVIDDKSPLFELSEKGLLESKIEIVAVLEGVVEATGMVMQAKTSYLPHEILWEHEFCPLSIQTNIIGNRMHFDFSKFDKTYSVKCNSKGIDSQQSHGHHKDTNTEGNGDIWVPRQIYKK